MSYWMRVLTQTNKTPKFKDLVAFLVKKGFTFTCNPRRESEQYDSDDWTEAQLEYDGYRTPIILERNSADGAELELVRSEISELLGDLEKVEDFKAKKEMQDFLQDIKQIYALKVPSDITDTGWQFIDSAGKFLARETEGLIQTDAEGFFSKDFEPIAIYGVV